MTDAIVLKTDTKRLVIAVITQIVLLVGQGTPVGAVTAGAPRYAWERRPDNDDRFADVVRILVTSPQNVAKCSGVLIAPKVVLSARHCFKRMGAVSVEHRTSRGVMTAMAVRVVSNDIAYYQESPSPTKQTAEFERFVENDFAIVYLDRDLPQTNNFIIFPRDTDEIHPAISFEELKKLFPRGYMFLDVSFRFPGFFVGFGGTSERSYMPMEISYGVTSFQATPVDMAAFDERLIHGGDSGGAIIIEGSKGELILAGIASQKRAGSCEGAAVHRMLNRLMPNFKYKPFVFRNRV